MKKTFYLSALWFSAALAFGAEYKIDPQHSAAAFSIKHMMISNVKGGFSGVNGTVIYDPNNLAASRVEATIDVKSVDTREPKRDEHLRSADFFDVAKYPVMTFKSKRIERGPSGLQIAGDLTIHGITKEVVLNVDGPTPELKDPWGNIRIGASASTKVNRKDFGLNWNAALEAGGVVVGDDVSITIDIEAFRKAPATAKGL